MNKTIVLSGILIVSLMLSCNQIAKKTETTRSETSLAAGTADPVVGPEQYCFKNEHPYTNEEGDSFVDVEYLEYTVEGNAVTGTFAWVPGEKGGLSGTISGTKNGHVIEAVFNETYAEEPYPIAVKITFSADEAMVTSTDESFGSYTIKQSDCK